MWAWLLVILALIALLLFGFGYASEISGDEAAQPGTYCAASVDGAPRCGPTQIDGEYQVPDAGVVVHVEVNNGPVSPKDQVGYGIDVDATGEVTVTETNPLHSEDSGTPTPDGATTSIRTLEIGESGVQSLLTAIEGCGYYGLPGQFDDANAVVPVGGPTSVVDVSLNDGFWSVSGATLTDPGDQATLVGCETVIVENLQVLVPAA